jgi:hypothetical protein
VKPETFVKVSALEGMAHENRKAGQALLALAEKQEAEAYDLRHGEGEAQRIKENMEVWK